MSDFNHLFSTFESTEIPPILTDDYKNTRSVYESLKYPGRESNFNIFQYPGKVDNGVSFSDDLFADMYQVSDEDNIELSEDLFLDENPVKTDASSQISRAVSPKSNLNTQSHKEYAQNMYSIFYQELENQGLDGSVWAPILVAHTALESNWGKSSLSAKYNNFGGFKGLGVSLATKEYSPERGYYTIKSNFKAFNSPQEYAKYYILQLKNKFHAFDNGPKNFVANIKRHRYFTAPLSKYMAGVNNNLRQVYNYLS